MKTLTKLALVSAVAMSGNAFAMQALDDSALSSTTGQDGITITLGTATTGIVADAIVVHDTDGITGSGLTAAQSGIATASAGAIVLGKQGGAAAGEDFSITGGDITVKIDADGNGTAPVLNVNIGLPAALTIKTGDIYVAKSGGVAAAAAAQYTNAAKILNSIDVVLNGATLNVQLGNAPQGAMIKLGGTVSTGLQINNFSLFQPTTTTAIAGTTIGSAGIHLGGINIRTANSADWNLTGNINATDAGLAISNLGSVDLRLTNVRLGLNDTAHQIGNVALLGLALPTVTISGH